jgi:hypothetical protein
MGNLALHHNEMLQLGMDIMLLMRSIAQSLATNHWAARYDARDVEFVLGQRPSHRPDDWALRDFGSLWCLDFNQCRPITMDAKGVHACAAAFYDNDPYYPRPGDEELWPIFRYSYLQIVGILDKRGKLDMKVIEEDLAVMFLDEVGELWRTRMFCNRDLMLPYRQWRNNSKAAARHLWWMQPLTPIRTDETDAAYSNQTDGK